MSYKQILGVVKYRDPSDECIPYEGAVDDEGRGRVKFKGKLYIAPRLALMVKLGRYLKPDEVARHTCDNAMCINPLHLEVGTQQDNMLDLKERGRWANQHKKGSAYDETV